MRQLVKITSSKQAAAAAFLQLCLAESAAFSFPAISLTQGALSSYVDQSTTPPILVLHMDGLNNSTTLADTAGATVTAMGSAKVSTSTAVNGTGSLILPGTTGSYLKIAQSTAYAMSTLDFTIEAYVKTSSVTTQTILGQWDGTNASGHTIFTVQNDGKLGLYFADVSIFNAALTGGAGVNDGKWHHVAYTRFGNTHTLWLDGKSVGTVVHSGSRFVSNVDLWIGQYQCCNNWPFNGSIDEVRITKGKALYISDFLPPTNPLFDIPGPDSISNLKLWLKADAITGLLDATAVANWSDVSGNGFNLSQATSGAQPIYKTNQINGMPVLRFNGTGAYLQGAFTGSIASKTMFAIVKLATLTPTGTASAGGPVTVQSSDGSIFDAIIYNEITAKRWMNGSDGLNRSPNLVSPTDETSLGPLLLAIRSTTSSYTLYRNTAQLQTTTAYSPPTFTNGKFNVGYRHTGGGSPYFHGDIAEVLIYDRALTIEERQRVENYLMTKYAISL